MPPKRSSKPKEAKPKPKPGKAAFNKYRELHRFQVEFKILEHPDLREDQRAREKQVEKQLGVKWSELSRDAKEEYYEAAGCFKDEAGRWVAPPPKGSQAEDGGGADQRDGDHEGVLLLLYLQSDQSQSFLCPGLYGTLE